VNILKTNSLQGQLFIDEIQQINLRGIHEELIQKIDKLSIPIIITNKNIGHRILYGGNAISYTEGRYIRTHLFIKK